LRHTKASRSKLRVSDSGEPNLVLLHRKILLTGRPGCGKTTLIKRVVKNLPQGAGGFYTEEIRDGGTRTGFKIVTLDGEEAVFAHVDFKTPDHVGKYGLDLSALERIGVGAVRRPLPFTDPIKFRPDVTLIEVRPDNRERLVSELSDRFQAMNPE
jgi:energy-coupling factor transporter ATP-binding protein EcfA2